MRGELGDVSSCGKGARVVVCRLTKTFTKSEELYPAESSVLSSNGSVALSSNAGTIKLVNLSWDSNGSMGVDDLLRQNQFPIIHQNSGAWFGRELLLPFSKMFIPACV